MKRLRGPGAVERGARWKLAPGLGAPERAVVGAEAGALLAEQALPRLGLAGLRELLAESVLRRLGGHGRRFPRRPVRARRGIHKYWRSSTSNPRESTKAVTNNRVKGFSISRSDFAGGRLSLLPANVSGHPRLRSTYDRALTAQSVEARARWKTGC